MTSERLASLFLLGVLLFNPPLLSIFDFPEYVLGIPVLYIYLFTAWAVLVVLMALTIESAAAAEEAEEAMQVVEDGGEPPGEEGGR
jgi:hypothetical protein